MGAKSITIGTRHGVRLYPDGSWRWYGTGGSWTNLSGAYEALAAGNDATLGLRSNGSTVDYGSVAATGSTMPTGPADAVYIALQGKTRMVLRANGTVRVWGDNAFGQEAVPVGLATVRKVATSGDHCLALKADGTVAAWGRNASGESTVPAGLADAVDIAAGSGYSLALRRNGTVAGWGADSFGIVASLAEFQDLAQIGASGGNAGGLTMSGQVVSFGSPANRFPPPPMFGRPTRRIAVGQTHAVVVSEDGTVSAWSGAIGPTPPEALPPTGLRGVVDVSAAVQYSIALRSNGTIVAWGPSTFRLQTTPTDLTGIVKVRASNTHVLALRQNETVVSWGGNVGGQQTIPPGLDQVVDIAVGRDFSVAVRRNGTVVVWGDTRMISATPLDLTHVTRVAASDWHIIALLSNGTLRGWGTVNNGQITPPSGLVGVTEIAAGRNHSFAVTSTGELRFWGTPPVSQDHGQYADPYPSRKWAGEVVGGEAVTGVVPPIVVAPIGGPVRTGEPVTMRVSISKPLPYNARVIIGTNGETDRGVSIPSELSIPAGTTSAKFTVRAINGFVGDGYITAGHNFFGTRSYTASCTVSFRPAALPAVGFDRVERSALWPEDGFYAHLYSSAPAPRGGLRVPITIDGAQGPAFVDFAPGQRRAAVLIKQINQVDDRKVTVSAQFPEGLRSAEIMVRGPGPYFFMVNSSFSLPPQVGGTTLRGYVTLYGESPPGGMTVELSSDDASVELPSSISVAAGGSHTPSFDVITRPVTTARVVTLTARVGTKVTKHFLRVIP